MTIRTYFNRRKKRILIALFGWAAMAFVSALLSVRHELLFLLTLLCVAAAIVIMCLAVLLGFRCPKCRGQWGYLAMYSGRTFSIRKDLRYCPYCGVELDKEI